MLFHQRDLTTSPIHHHRALLADPKKPSPRDGFFSGLVGRRGHRHAGHCRRAVSNRDPDVVRLRARKERPGLRVLVSPVPARHAVSVEQPSRFRFPRVGQGDDGCQQPPRGSSRRILKCQTATPCWLDPPVRAIVRRPTGTPWCDRILPLDYFPLLFGGWIIAH